VNLCETKNKVICVLIKRSLLENYRYRRQKKEFKNSVTKRENQNSTFILNMEEEKFTLLRRFQYSSEAIIYQGKLESHGIEVFMRDNNIVDSNPLYSNAVGGVKMFVKTEDFEKANEVLNEVSLYSVDDDHQPLKCPKCGAEQIEMETSIDGIKSFFQVLFFGAFALLFSKHKHKCQNCKHEFD
jgi:hypothetical protein